ncbi:MAG: VOC family protein [Gammaproteobacteria bacterium]|nr:VOC family protein [Gammaproteobacteria bacterium]MDH5729234.1 VOC family protein [Gammaproteobacteria bacterium]
MTSSITQGVHHVGLTVSNLEASADFFISLLGWKEVKRRDDYPAIFVSDGHMMLTLWATKELPVNTFDKNRNVGLHHIALQVSCENDLNLVFEKLISHDIAIEFSPELLGPGPAKHMMCYDPSGLRIEIIWPGN